MENLSVMDLARQFAGKLADSPELSAKTAQLKEQLMGHGIPSEIANAFVASYLCAITDGLALGMLYVLRSTTNQKGGEDEQKMRESIAQLMQGGGGLVN